MTKNDFIHRVILGLISKASAQITVGLVRYWARDAKKAADILEEDGIFFDTCTDVEKDDEEKDGTESRLVTEQDENEARIISLRNRREEIHNEITDILDRNSTCNPDALPSEELKKYIDANFELRYIRDELEYVYQTIKDKTSIRPNL